MADGSDLLLDFNPSDNPAGRQLLLAALQQQDRGIQWGAHFGNIERVTGGNVCDTDQLAGSAQWKIKLDGVDKPLGLKAYTRFIQAQLNTCPGSSPKPPLASTAPQDAFIPGTSDCNIKPSAVQHRITQGPLLSSTASHKALCCPAPHHTKPSAVQHRITQSPLLSSTASHKALCCPAPHHTKPSAVQHRITQSPLLSSTASHKALCCPAPHHTQPSAVQHRITQGPLLSSTASHKALCCPAPHHTRPSAVQHRITQGPSMPHASSTAAHAGPVLGLVDLNRMETSVLPGCGATQQAQERLNTLLGPVVYSHSSAHQGHTSTKAHTKDAAACRVPSTAETATAATRRMPRLANCSGGSPAECLQLQLRKPSNMSGAACSSGSGRILAHAQRAKSAEITSADPAAAAWSAPPAPAATGSTGNTSPGLSPCQPPSLDHPVAQQQPALRSQAELPNQTAPAGSEAQQVASKQADAAGPASTTRTVEELLARWQRKRKAADVSVGADAGYSNDPAAGEQAAGTTAGRVPYDIPAPPCPAQWPQLVEWARGVLALKQTAALAAAGGKVEAGQAEGDA